MCASVHLKSADGTAVVVSSGVFSVQAVTSATTRAGLDRSFTSARNGSSSKLQNLARSASGPLVDKSEASGDAQGSTQNADAFMSELPVCQPLSDASDGCCMV